MKKWFSTHKHIWVLSYFFVYITWFFLLEQIAGPFHEIRCALDDQIPVINWFVIPYLLWFFYVAATVLVFFFTNVDDFYHCTAFLFIGMTISLIVFSVYPSEFDRGIPVSDGSICSYLVYLVHKIDTNTNVFPSIHCFNSIGCSIVLLKCQTFSNKNQTAPSKILRNRLIKLFSIILTVLICLSTVFIKQHSVIDFVGAVGLSIVMYVIVYAIPWKCKNIFLLRFRKSKLSETKSH